MDDIRTRMGLLRLSDAARFLSIPPQRFREWARGYDGRPLLHVLEREYQQQATVPFIGMAEAYVLDALRHARVQPRKIRPALEKLKQEFGEYALMAPELATDGIDVLWDFSRSSPEGDGLIEASTGQHVIRDIVLDALQYIVRGDDGYPEMLRLRHWHPAKIVVDPHRAWGAPIFEDTRTRVIDVALMLKAGEKPEVVADELGVTLDETTAATRILLGRAA